MTLSSKSRGDLRFPAWGKRRSRFHWRTPCSMCHVCVLHALTAPRSRSKKRDSGSVSTAALTIRPSLRRSLSNSMATLTRNARTPRSICVARKAFARRKRARPVRSASAISCAGYLAASCVTPRAACARNHGLLRRSLMAGSPTLPASPCRVSTPVQQRQVTPSQREPFIGMSRSFSLVRHHLCPPSDARQVACVPSGNLVPSRSGVLAILLENAMKDVSLMSRADLVCALITSTTMTAKAAVIYAKTRDPAVSGNRDALVSYKLAVARALLMRDLAERMKAEPVLSAPGTVRDWLRLRCADLEHEVFIFLLLDSQNRLIEAHELFRGTLSQTSVYPREVVKYTLARNAAAVVFAHNHPSGV